MDDLCFYAKHIGFELPRNSMFRIGELVAKHAPGNDSLTDERERDMARLQRAAREFTLKYDGPAYKRARFADSEPLRT